MTSHSKKTSENKAPRRPQHQVVHLDWPRSTERGLGGVSGSVGGAARSGPPPSAGVMKMDANVMTSCSLRRFPGTGGHVGRFSRENWLLLAERRGALSSDGGERAGVCASAVRGAGGGGPGAEPIPVLQSGGSARPAGPTPAARAPGPIRALGPSLSCCFRPQPRQLTAPPPTWVSDPLGCGRSRVPSPLAAPGAPGAQRAGTRAGGRSRR